MRAEGRSEGPTDKGSTDWVGGVAGDDLQSGASVLGEEEGVAELLVGIGPEAPHARHRLRAPRRGARHPAREG